MSTTTRAEPAAPHAMRAASRPRKRLLRLGGLVQSRGGFRWTDTPDTLVTSTVTIAVHGERVRADPNAARRIARLACPSRADDAGRRRCRPPRRGQLSADPQLLQTPRPSC